MRQLLYAIAVGCAVVGAMMTVAHLWALHGTLGLVGAVALLPVLYVVVPLQLFLLEGAWLPIVVNLLAPLVATSLGDQVAERRAAHRAAAA
jgi:hypothetical protein